jgi:hypothetical protein
MLLICAASLLPVLTGCGGGGGSDVDVGPAAAVPADTPVYLEATLQPQGTAQQDADAALGKILDTDDPSSKLISLIEQSAAQEGNQIDFAQDVQPWLGERAGVFFSSLEGEDNAAVVIEQTDSTAAQAFIQKAADPGSTPEELNGSDVSVEPDGDVSGVVGDFVISGSKTAFEQAAAAEGGDSLGESDQFKDSIGDLPDDRLGALYSVPKDFLEALPADQINPTLRSTFEKAAGDAADEPVVGDLTASADDIELNLSAAGGGDTPESSLIDAVPAQAWLALSLGDLGGSLQKGIDQLKEAGTPNLEQGISQIESATGASLDELTGAVGDAALYVQGTNQQTLNGALVMQSKDTELTNRLLTQLQTLLGASGNPQFKQLSIGGGGSGFQFRDPTSTPQPFEVAQQGDKIVFGYGAGSAQQALGDTGGAIGGQLSTTPAFADASSKLSSLGVDFFLNFAPVFELAESEGAAKDPDFQQAKPYIDALDFLGVGSGADGDRASVRFVVGLK